MYNKWIILLLFKHKIYNLILIRENIIHLKLIFILILYILYYNIS